MSVRARFEEELRLRKLGFAIDESGRHAIELGGRQLLVSLDNLERDVASDGDLSRVSRFVDAIEASTQVVDDTLSADALYWSLEPNDYEVSPDFRVALSERVDRALVHLSVDGRLLTWVSQAMLSILGLTESDASERAFANLAQALREATFESQEIEGVPLGFLETSLPFKAALILAPNLREVVGARLGWPLLAVVPDRDFLYLWPSQHRGFAQRVGAVVVREYAQAPYPISTEVYEITDDHIRAIGAFPVESE